MKTVRIASTVKLIEEADHRVTLFQIQEILSEHRANLVTRVLGDLSIYLSFKFYIKVEKEMQDRLRDKLIDLANSKLSLDRYMAIVKEIEACDNYRVSSHEFFREIDTLLDSVLNPTQLTLRIEA